MPLGHHTRELLVKRSGSSAPPVRLDAFRDAASILSEDSEAICVAIELQPASAGLGGTTVAADRALELGELLQVPAPILNIRTSGAYWLRYREKQRSGVRISTVCTERLLYVHAYSAGAFAIDEQAEDAETWLIGRSSLACRAEASTVGVAALLHSAVVDETIRRLLTTGQDLAMSARNSARADAELLTPSVDILFAHRQQLTQLAAFLHQNDDKELREAVHQATTETDALGNFLAGALLARLIEREQQRQRTDNERREQLDRLRGEDERRQRERDHLLGRFAAALLIPTMWITYWSTKPAPDLGSVNGSLALWLGAAALSAVAYVTAGKLIEVLADRRRGEDASRA